MKRQTYTAIRLTALLLIWPSALIRAGLKTKLGKEFKWLVWAAVLGFFGIRFISAYVMIVNQAAF